MLVFCLLVIFCAVYLIESELVTIRNHLQQGEVLKKGLWKFFKLFILELRISEVNLDQIESNLGYYLLEVLKSEEKKFEKEKFPEKQDQSF